MKEMKEMKVPVSYRLNESAKAWLSRKAKENDRSANYLLNQILKKQMEEEINAKQASSN